MNLKPESSELERERETRRVSIFKRERESRLLNPPPGSTDPERFATVSTGIGGRVLFHPAPSDTLYKPGLSSTSLFQSL